MGGGGSRGGFGCWRRGLGGDPFADWLLGAELDSMLILICVKACNSRRDFPATEIDVIKTCCLAVVMLSR